MGRSDWARRYAPITAMVVALLLVIAVLPSALNTPQSNPTTTPEFAPVPPTGDNAAPPGGNVSSFGLASSASSAAAVAATTTQPPPSGSATQGIAGKTPRTKRCVGQPPRQTDDPLAPPCVADFRGDNFGATYQGVTAEEARVLFYVDGGATLITSNGTEPTPQNHYVDIDNPTSADQQLMFVRILQVFQTYFNDRYQTYNRHVHFFAYFSSSARTAEVRRSDAADNFEQIKPFAVVSAVLLATAEEEYLNEMARHGVLVFGSQSARPAEFFQRRPGLAWSFLPSVEQHARQFVSLLCHQVVPFPVSFSGNPADQAQPRRLGLLYSADPNFPEMKLMTDLVEAGVKECGGSFVDRGAIPNTGCYSCGDAAVARQTMARFRQSGVTTVVWTGGLELHSSQAATELAYHPEWVVTDPQGRLEANDAAQVQDQAAWQYTFALTPRTLQPTVVTDPCYAAFKEVDPSSAISNDDLNYYACRVFYPHIRQLFVGVQVAGPRLGPASIDRGFHAIPAVASTNPQVPACFYDAGDYSCVKDAIVQWWDPAAKDPAAPSTGCYKAVEQGSRRLYEEWPNRDIAAVRSTNDPCNGYRLSSI